MSGYVRGGCSPLGMKNSTLPLFMKVFAYEEIYVSGGRIGTTLKLNPKDLAVVSGKFVEITGWEWPN